MYLYLNNKYTHLCTNITQATNEYIRDILNENITSSTYILKAAIVEYRDGYETRYIVFDFNTLTFVSNTTDNSIKSTIDISNLKLKKDINTKFKNIKINIELDLPSFITFEFPETQEDIERDLLIKIKELESKKEEAKRISDNKKKAYELKLKENDDALIKKTSIDSMFNKFKIDITVFNKLRQNNSLVPSFFEREYNALLDLNDKGQLNASIECFYSYQNILNENN